MNPFMPLDSSTSTLWTGLFSIKWGSSQFVLLQCFIDIPELNGNSVDPDQTPRPGSTLFANVPFMGR